MLIIQESRQFTLLKEYFNELLFEIFIYYYNMHLYPIVRVILATTKKMVVFHFFFSLLNSDSPCMLYQIQIEEKKFFHSINTKNSPLGKILLAKPTFFYSLNLPMIFFN